LARINLAFCIHSHQPTGNFPWVFRNAYDRAYRPFLEVVRRHPHIKVVLHYSGSLLTWLEENRLEIFDNISYLVRQGRAEMLTGGFYEPILAIIPERDTLGQITYLTEYLKRHFDADPKGLWLTERVQHAALSRGPTGATGRSEGRRGDRPGGVLRGALRGAGT